MKKKIEAGIERERQIFFASSGVRIDGILHAIVVIRGVETV